MLFIRLYLGMSIPWCGKIGKGKFPQSSLKAHFIFPSHGLAVMVKKNFPSRGFAAPGEIFVSPVAAPPLLGKLFFTNPAKPFLGKIKCAFRDSWGNFSFPGRGFATPGEKTRPYFSTPRDWAIVSWCKSCPFCIRNKKSYLVWYSSEFVTEDCLSYQAMSKMATSS